MPDFIFPNTATPTMERAVSTDTAALPVIPVSSKLAEVPDAELVAQLTQIDAAVASIFATVHSAVQSFTDENDLLVCTRVWEAWSNGTMSPGDFIAAAEDDVLLEDFTTAVAAAVFRRILGMDEEATHG